jgi:hypothetical protein
VAACPATEASAAVVVNPYEAASAPGAEVTETVAEADCPGDSVSAVGEALADHPLGMTFMRSKVLAGHEELSPLVTVAV